MILEIDDFPFTEEEKEAIRKMGITVADWGHPEVVLDDPVAYFRDQIKNFAKGIPVVKNPLSRMKHLTSPEDQPIPRKGKLNP